MELSRFEINLLVLGLIILILVLLWGVHAWEQFQRHKEKAHVRQQ